MAKTITLPVVLLCLLAGCSSGSSQFQEAAEAYSQRDYEKALTILIPLAESGNPSAQFNLGVLYENGEGVPRDMSEALKWYRQAADQGLPVAAYKLGILYSLGEGGARNEAAAVEWFYRAGMGYLRNGEEQFALTSLEQARRISPTNPLTEKLSQAIGSKNP